MLTANAALKALYTLKSVAISVYFSFIICFTRLHHKSSQTPLVKAKSLCRDWLWGLRMNYFLRCPKESVHMAADIVQHVWYLFFFLQCWIYTWSSLKTVFFFNYFLMWLVLPFLSVCLCLFFCCLTLASPLEQGPISCGWWWTGSQTTQRF